MPFTSRHTELAVGSEASLLQAPVDGVGIRPDLGDAPGELPQRRVTYRERGLFFQNGLFAVLA